MSTRDFTIAAKHDLNIFSFVKIAAIFLYQYSLIRRRNYYIRRYCFKSKPKFLHACVKYCLPVAIALLFRNKMNRIIAESKISHFPIKYFIFTGNFI